MARVRDAGVLCQGSCAKIVHSAVLAQYFIYKPSLLYLF